MMFPALARRCITELRRPSVLGNSGALARFARNPVPFRAPWRSEILHVHRNMGLGDVLMCTPALREVKRLNPKCFIRFYTDLPEILRGLPYIDAVLPFGERPSDSISIGYEDAIPPRSHLAKIMGDTLGVRVTDVRPDCVIRSDYAEDFRMSWAHLPRPHIVILRRAGRHTPNKDWPDYSWIALAGRLAQFGSVIEIGEAGHAAAEPPPRNYVDLRGRTSLEQLAAAIAAADLHVGPDSGPMHVAAAAGTPSVVIYGGYIGPANTLYPGNVALAAPVTCSPCWLRSPCPFDRQCLSGVSPGDVEEAVRKLWRGMAVTPRSAEPRYGNARA
jgi:ADP-heptose:LPS heptosyltransferase